MLQPGDRVRLLKGREEGVVKSVLKQGRVLVVWDDFDDEEEVLEKDIVGVRPEEDVYFGKIAVTKPEEIPIAAVKHHEPGLQFVAFVPLNAQEHEVWLVNPANYDIFYTLFLKIRGKYQPFHAGKAGPGAKLMTGKLHADQFRFLNGLLYQSLTWSNADNFRARLPQQLELKVDQSLGREWITELGRDGVRVDLVEPPPVVEEVKKPTGILEQVTAPPDVVDLHIEELSPEHAKMSPAEMLDLQTRTFENMLDKAIAANMKKIVFIHGVGAGVLRLELQRRLDKRDFIKSHRPANIFKYGNGAIEVELE